MPAAIICSSFIVTGVVCAKLAVDKKTATQINITVTGYFFLSGFILSNHTYNTGNTSKVSKVAETKPPITTVANGRCTSAPAPLLNAMGKNPSEATAAVINTGRKRILVPCNTTCFISATPAALRRLNSAINTMPFNTATPNKAIKPTPAEILKGMPLAISANMPPMADKGMAEKISKPYFMEPKAK